MLMITSKNVVELAEILKFRGKSMNLSHSIP